MRSFLAILTILMAFCGSCVKAEPIHDWSFNLGLQVSFEHDGDRPKAPAED